MDIGKAFSYMFDDPKWIQKILIGGVLSFIPIINFAVFGYMIQIARNVAAGHEQPLPDWANFGDFFMGGLKIFVISLIYSLPLIILMCIFMVPIAIADSADSSDVMAILVGLGGLCFVVVLLGLALIISFLSTAAILRFAATNDFGAALRIGEIVSFMRTYFGEVLMLWLMYLVAGFIGGIGSVVFIGVIFTVPYGYYMVAHVLGQTIQRVTPNQTQTAPPVTQF